MLLYDSIYTHIEDLKYSVDYEVKSHTSNPISAMEYIFFNGALSISTNMEGAIISFFCNFPYRGRMLGQYYAGMTLGEFFDITPSYRYLSGYLTIGNELGGGFELLEKMEMYDAIVDLPLDTILDKMFVMSRDWQKQNSEFL